MTQYAQDYACCPMTERKKLFCWPSRTLANSDFHGAGRSTGK